MKLTLAIPILLFAQYSLAQNIEIKIDVECNTSITLNGKRLIKDGVYELLPSASGIRFQVTSRAVRKNYKVRISRDGSAAFSFTLDSGFFRATNAISSDATGNLVINNRTVSLRSNQLFKIAVACDGVPDGAMACAFEPVAGTVPAGVNGEAAITSSALSANTENTVVSNARQSAEKVYHPGSIVHDALFLSGNPPEIERTDVVKIMRYYFGNSLTSSDQIADAIADNNFLKPVFNPSFIGRLKDPASNTVNAQGGVGDIFSKLSLSSIGGLDVTNIADGLAKFLVKRAKQELSITFFKKLKDAIHKTPDIKTVFPQTADLLDAIDEDIYDYEKYVQNLRESFKQDITAIHRNLPGIVENHPGFFSRHQPVKAGLLTACYAAQELENESHPGDMLANYPVEYLDSIPNRNYKGAIQTVQLLSASLRDTVTGKDAGYWVSIEKMRELVNNKRAFKIYLGLLLQEARHKYESIPYENTDLVTLLNKVAQRYDTVLSVYNSYRSYILRLGEKAVALNRMIKDHAGEAAADSAVLEKYAKYFRTSVDLIAYGTEAFRLPVIADVSALAKFPPLFKKYIGISYTAADLVTSISHRNYSAVINHTVQMYNQITVKAAGDSTAIIESGQTYDSTTAVAEQKYFKTPLSKLVRYGGFMATVATAKNSDDVATAIETAALPVGSSRIKRVADFNASINAYAGLFYGIERISKVDSGKWKPNVYGVTAPVGVAASWGHRLFFIKTKCEWSTSIFVSLIDIGAIAAFRFTDDSTAQIPTVRLKNIFSPGAFLSIGIPKTPLSLNFGAQAGANLRKVSADPAKPNEFADKTYWRFSTSIVVDIPLLNLHTRSR